MDSALSAAVQGDVPAGSKATHAQAESQAEQGFCAALKQAAVGLHRASFSLGGATVSGLSPTQSVSCRPTEKRTVPTEPDPSTAPAPAGAGPVSVEHPALAPQAISTGEPELRSFGPHRLTVEEAGSALSVGAPAAAAGGAQVNVPIQHEFASRSFAPSADQPQTGVPHTSSCVTVQLPDGASAVSGFDVNVLPDGAVDMVLTVDHQALRTVSDQLDRLKRRLEAKGVSIAGIQLEAADPMSSEDSGR